MSLPGNTSCDVCLDQSLVFGADVLRLTIATVGITSNILLFVLFKLYNLLSTDSNWFLLSLAVTDTLSLTYDVLIIICRFIGSNVTESLPCFIESFGLVIPTLNISHVSAIAFERFLFICCPMYYHDVIFKWKKVMILVSWLVPLSIFVPLVNVLYCQKIFATFFISFFATYLMLAAILVATLFYSVFKTARHQLNGEDQNRNNDQGAFSVRLPKNEESLRRKRRYSSLGYDLKLVKCYALIVGSTFVTYSLPISVFYALILGSTNVQLLMKIQVISGALATLNNSINPFVYFYSQKQMRKHLFRLMRRGSQRRHKRELVRQIVDDIGPDVCLENTLERIKAPFMRRTNTVDAINADSKRVNKLVVVERPMGRRNSSCPDLAELQAL